MLGIAELLAHGCIDFGRGEGWYGTMIDQILHVSCKLAWLGILVFAYT